MQLTPEQRRMLDALPSAQRAQAEAAMRQLQAQQSESLLRPVSEVREDELPEAEPTFDLDEPDEEEVPRAESGSRIVLEIVPKLTLDKDAAEELADDRLLSSLVGIHHLVLDESGAMSLKGLEAIPLLGLGEADIETRLSAEPYLALFDVTARILEMSPTGAAALQPFGYDVFESQDTTFDPSVTGPVPADYVLGPGDSIRVQLFGNENGVYEFDVTRDGVLNLPELGPINVSGLTFSELRRDLRNRVSETLIGTEVSVSMGQLRTIRVFVLGDVNAPGSYVVGSLATISSALYRSGGISEVGSLRRVQLKRNGRVVANLDLYDLLLNGDTSGDVRLQTGDAIFVPPVGPTVGVGGAVRRPAIYESKGGLTASDAVRLAGGLAPDAFPKAATVARIDDNGERTVISVDVSAERSGPFAVLDGDVLTVPEVLPDFQRAVMLQGHVYRPGAFEWRPGLRLTDVVRSPQELKPGVDDRYVLIRRERVRGRPIEVLSADLAAAFRERGGAEDLELAERDTIYVFGMEYGRQRIVASLLDELRLHSTPDRPFRKVEISGDVRAPGEYPLDRGMRVSDLIRASGNLGENAYTLKAELTRYSATSREIREVDVVDVDLAAVLRGDASADPLLQAHDHVSITRVPQWESAWSVTLDGEVRFPGIYRVRRGENLQSVLERAGGLTDEAFAEGAVFLRESLQEQEREQIEVLARRMEADLASLSLQSVDTSGAETLSTGRALLRQLRATEPTGRLVLSRDLLLGSESGTELQVELRDGDMLLVPQKPQVVTVIGEAQQNTSHLYRQDLSRNDYIEMSGGLTRRADKGRIYIVRASGTVVPGGRSRWLGRDSGADILPGDTIVVPLDTDRMR
ncbi:MAG: SLBB domain-containing protein, partial [Proteobacteria bacterium]|nr:SLBB domain-containing protein [Pseudomonadota bacterium]